MESLYFRLKMCYYWCIIPHTVVREETWLLNLGVYAYILTLGVIEFVPFLWQYVNKTMEGINDAKFFTALWDNLHIEASQAMSVFTKTGFYDACRDHGIPHPQCTEPADLDPAKKYWVKATISSCGRGHFVYDPSTEPLPEEKDLVYQEILVPHKDILKLLTHTHLATFRVTTVSILGEDPKCYGPYALRCAPKGSLLDNDQTRPGRIILFCGNDGVFTKAMEFPSQQEVSTIPNGADWKGQPVPFFREMLALCERAHRTFIPDVITAGWDVAITDEGPKLIEVNDCSPVMEFWRPEIHQKIMNSREQQLRYILAKRTKLRSKANDFE